MPSRLTVLPAAVIAACCLGSAALAQERPWYVTLDAGVSSAGDPDFAGGRLTTRPGMAYGGAIGRQIGTDFRVEAGLMYRSNAVRQVSSPGFDPRPGDADWASVLITVNAFYDFAGFKLGRASVRPYVGLGIGRVERFWCAPGQTRPGSGLGLALVADIAAAHGWAVTCEKAAGGGASFQVRWRP